MGALIRLFRWLIALIAIVASAGLLVAAYTSWSTKDNVAAGAEVTVALLFIVVASRIRPGRSGSTKPTKKQLEFAKRLGINPKGLDKWALSDAIDQALDERDSARSR